MVCGKYKYVPKITIDELELTKKNFKVPDSEAFKIITDDAKLGRRLKQIIESSRRLVP